VRTLDVWATAVALVLFLVGAGRGEVVLSAVLAVASFGAVELVFPAVRAQLEPLLAFADNRRALVESRRTLAEIAEACERVPAGQAGREQLLRLRGKLERAHELIGRNRRTLMLARPFLERLRPLGPVIAAYAALARRSDRGAREEADIERAEQLAFPDYEDRVDRLLIQLRSFSGQLSLRAALETLDAMLPPLAEGGAR